MARFRPPMLETTSVRREADDARARPARKTGSEAISRDSKTMMISAPGHPRRTNAMKLEFIPLHKLSVSKANMRHGKKPPDISDILPTVRARVVIHPIPLRPTGGPASFESVAGRRRFHPPTLVDEYSRTAGRVDPPQSATAPECRHAAGSDSSRLTK